MNSRPALFAALASALFACTPPRMTADADAQSDGAMSGDIVDAQEVDASDASDVIAPIDVVDDRSTPTSTTTPSLRLSQRGFAQGKYAIDLDGYRSAASVSLEATCVDRSMARIDMQPTQATQVVSVPFDGVLLSTSLEVDVVLFDASSRTLGVSTRHRFEGLGDCAEPGCLIAARSSERMDCGARGGCPDGGSPRDGITQGSVVLQRGERDAHTLHVEIQGPPALDAAMIRVTAAGSTREHRVTSAPMQRWRGESSCDIDPRSPITVTAMTDGPSPQTHRFELFANSVSDNGDGGVAMIPVGVRDGRTETSVSILNTLGAIFDPREQRALSIVERPALVVVSHVRSHLDAPAAMQVEINDRGPSTITRPTSVMRGATITVPFSVDVDAQRFRVVVDGEPIGPMGAFSFCNRGFCARGMCFCLSGSGSRRPVDITTYADRIEDLPAQMTVRFEGERGERVTSEEQYTVRFGDAVSVLFAVPIRAQSAFHHQPLRGTVRLLGAARDGGARLTIAEGSFRAIARIGATDRGALSLSFAPQTSAIDPRGDILIGSDPIGIERGSATPGGVLWSAPPVVLLTSGAGMGTRNAASTTMQTQQAHLL
jgi:hypothetical protein